MSAVKRIQLRPILPRLANAFIERHHYSGKVVPNSQLHFGAFLDGRLQGVLQFGPSLNKKGTIKLVPGTGWNEFIELNRMAFTDVLPRNSESRCIAVALRLIRKHAPHIKWVISFADATQCGTGAIYRAAGFKLVEVMRNRSIRVLPDGQKIHDIQAYHLRMTNEQRRLLPKVEGYQIKYLYKYDQDYSTIKVLPYSELDKITYPDGVRHSRGLVNV